MRQNTHHTSGIRLGLAVMACDVALGAASAVTVVNALYELVS